MREKNFFFWIFLNVEKNVSFIWKCKKDFFQGMKNLGNDGTQCQVGICKKTVERIMFEGVRTGWSQLENRPETEEEGSSACSFRFVSE